jgi:hypothetical protein
VALRPLPRSLDPLPDESLPGYLLRLAHRLDQPPAHIAELTGLAQPDNMIPRRHLYGLDAEIAQRFSIATRLTPQEVTGLSLTDLGGRYPPLDLTGGAWIRQTQGITGLGRWVFAGFTRFCPDCLAGDGSAMQHRHGGAWNKHWRLPLMFACLTHQRLLLSRCPACHSPAPGGSGPGLIPRAREVLHPAHCRADTDAPGTDQHRQAPCGYPLDTPTVGRHPEAVDDAVLAAQRDLVDVLRPDGPHCLSSCGQPVPAAQYILDLRLVAGLIRITWPLPEQLVGSAVLAEALTGHAEQQDRAIRDRAGTKRASAHIFYDTPPSDSAACAALLIAATRILDNNPVTLDAALPPLVLAAAADPAWHGLFRQAKLTCSPTLSDTIDSAMLPLRPPDRRRGTNDPNRPRRPPPPRKTPGHPPTPTAAPEHSVRTYRRLHGYLVIPLTGPCRFDHRHIPQRLPGRWTQRALPQLGDASNSRHIRRVVALTLVQLSTGGSVPAAAATLGLPTATGTSSHTEVRRWALPKANRTKLAAAIAEIADDLNADPGRTDYGNRRDQLADWTIPADDWNTLTADLQHPGSQNEWANWDELTRLVASVLVWATVTDGEHRLAPLIRRLQHGPAERLRTETRRIRGSILQAPAGPYTALANRLTTYAAELSHKLDRTNAATPGQLE